MRRSVFLPLALMLLAWSGCGESDEAGPYKAGAGNAAGRSGAAGSAGKASGGSSGVGAGGTGTPAGGSSGSGAGGTGTPTGGSSGSGGVSSGGSAGTAGSAGTVDGGNTGGTAGSAGTGTGGSAGTSGVCDPGSSTTAWATSCPTSTQSCTAGNWTAAGSNNGDPLAYESPHFAFYFTAGTITTADAQLAGNFLENVVWPTYMGSPIFFREPYCNSSNKRKASIHIRSSYGLTGGGWGSGNMGMWIGPGAVRDHWGLGHEFMHALQSSTGGLGGCNPNTCGWIWESHANFMPHQLPEYRSDVHCSEMLMNAPHLYYGSTRDRYCNWQFFEFLKDKHCYKAVNDIWTGSAASGEKDPFTVLANNMGWNAEQLNDLFGEWAMHNITWDYQNPPPTSGGNQGATYRQAYGAITDKSRLERRLRLTALEPLGADYATTRRFFSPYFWAPQRWGYNVVRLYPDAGAASVRVRFRGVTQSGASSGWRFGLVATNAGFTTARYSKLGRGADGEIDFCVSAGESVWLVVLAAPTVIQRVVWDQPYPSIYRYPYMVELGGAWPDGFRNGQQDGCASGQRHSNGGGCVAVSVPPSVYVGPYAQVLGGSVTGTARIEDHAVVAGGTVSGGRVSALSLMNRFSVSDTAQVQTTFYPVGFFETGQAVSGTATLYGDVEYRGQGLNKSSGSYYGFVEGATASAPISDVTVAPPYSWRP